MQTLCLSPGNNIQLARQKVIQTVCPLFKRSKSSHGWASSTFPKSPSPLKETAGLLEYNLSGQAPGPQGLHLFIYLKIFFLMWKTSFKFFIEFVTILLLFHVLVFWPQGIWDLSFPTRDRTRTPCIGRQSLNHWTTRKSPRAPFRTFSLALGFHFLPPIPVGTLPFPTQSYFLR